MATNQQEIVDLNSKIQRLEAEITTGAGGARHHQIKSASGTDTNLEHPIMNRKKPTLTAGVANMLLNELRRELVHTQQEKADLLKSIVTQKGEFAQEHLSHSPRYTKTDVYHQILKHIVPMNSIMQYHRLCGGLHLLLSNIPVLKTGCYLEFSQIKGMWNQADAAAKDTLAFMWCLNELKLP